MGDPLALQALFYKFVKLSVASLEEVIPSQGATLARHPGQTGELTRTAARNAANPAESHRISPNLTADSAAILLLPWLAERPRAVSGDESACWPDPHQLAI